MEKQKFTQKEWYESPPPPRGRDIIQVAGMIHIQQLMSLFPVKGASLSLNCGCGRGGQEDIFGPSIGIDISFENIRSLIQRGGQGVIADMEFLPFKDQTFDLVYGFGILHHLNNIKKGVSEATRVLKHGGHIGFGGENNGLCPLVYIMSFVYRNWRIEKGSYRIRKRRLKKIFHESGVRDFVMRRHGMTIYGLGSVVYKLTSFMDKFLSRFSTLNTFSGYCYVAGRKV